MPCGSARTLCLGSVLLALSCTPLRAPKEVAPEGRATETPQQKGDRVPALLPTAPNYDHFEGVAYRNSCDDDSECHLGGCSSEICSSDVDATSACMVYNDKPTAPCGCVKGQCIWYVTGAAADEMRAALKASSETSAGPKTRPASEVPSGGLPDQGQACADGRCAPGLECITFFGIGG